MGDEEQAVREVRIVERGARAVPNTFYGDSNSNDTIHLTYLPVTAYAMKFRMTSASMCLSF